MLSLKSETENHTFHSLYTLLYALCIHAYLWRIDGIRNVRWYLTRAVTWRSASSYLCDLNTFITSYPSTCDEAIERHYSLRFLGFVIDYPRLSGWQKSPKRSLMTRPPNSHLKLHQFVSSYPYQRIRQVNIVSLMSHVSQWLELFI